MLRAIISFYSNSKACARVGKGVSDWIEVNMGFQKGVCDVAMAVKHVHGWGSEEGECWSALLSPASS